jgi:hypothetical protein
MPFPQRKSKHPPIERESLKPFTCLQKYFCGWEPPGIAFGSAFLNTLTADNRICFTSDTDILYMVFNIFKDNIKMMELNEKVAVHSEMATTVVLGAWDCGTVLTVSLRGRPVCVVHVTSPATGAVTRSRTAEHVLSNKRKLGQAYDGMMELMSFCGREQCFAILTTLKEWKIIWLPTCDASAAASDLPPGSGNATLAAPAERGISSSGVIPHDHPLLVKMLMSVIEKCTASRVSPVPLLSTSRMYIRMRTKDWSWMRLDDATVADYGLRLSFAVDTAIYKDPEYAVLKPLAVHSECLTWVAIARQSCSVCVVKQTASKEDADHEVRVWRAAVGNRFVYKSKIANKHSVVMPFVFCAAEDGNVVRFEYSVYSCGDEGRTSAGSVPAVLAQEITAIRQLAVDRGLSNVHTAAAQAIGRFASAGIQYNDLDWGKVAIMPLFEGGRLTAVQPVLIGCDRHSCEVGIPVETARANMLAELDAISVDMVFG